MLMAILGFPVVIPVLLLLIRLSGKAIEGIGMTALYKDWIGLASIIVIAVTASIILFPYLWRSN
jgi:heme exporter protein B